MERRGQGEGKNTYNTRDSLVVTDPTTSLALIGLSMGERTGSRVLQWVWSYVTRWEGVVGYQGVVVWCVRVLLCSDGRDC